MWVLGWFRPFGACTWGTTEEAEEVEVDTSIYKYKLHMYMIYIYIFVSEMLELMFFMLQFGEEEEEAVSSRWRHSN